MFNMHTVYTRLYILYCYDPENLGSIASVERTEQKRLLRVAVFFSTRSSIWYRSERDDRVMAEGHDFKTPHRNYTFYVLLVGWRVGKTDKSRSI